MSNALSSSLGSCMFSLVESVAEGMEYPPGALALHSTFSAWSDMLSRARQSIDIAAYYFSLTGGPATSQGQQIFDMLLTAGTQRRIKIRIAQTLPSPGNPSTDSETLAKNNAAEVRSLDWHRLIGSGILHTKMWVVDKRHIYIGSANMDWRSLEQVKELGIYITDCPIIAEDVWKLFEIYWLMGAEDAAVPLQWHPSLDTRYNKDMPLNLCGDGSTSIYLSSSPSQICTSNRTGDLDAILSTIAKARKFIYISVMDFVPLYIYAKPAKYWGVIDNALRTAAIDNAVDVRLLISWWAHSRENMKLFLRSLAVLTDGRRVSIQVRLFKVPATEEQAKIPHARVNHNKYMVTENTAYIGTSNWTADYFMSTGGVGVIVEGDTEVRSLLERYFLRDWQSEYAYNL